MNCKTYEYCNEMLMVFLGAFCSPGLSPRQRLEGLEKVEQWIKSTTCSGCPFRQGRLKTLLTKYFAGEDVEKELAEVSFSTWNFLLLEIKKEENPNTPEAVQQAFNKLLTT